MSRDEKVLQKMSLLGLDCDEEIETSSDTLVPSNKSLVQALDDFGLVKARAGFGKKLCVTAVAVGIPVVGTARVLSKMHLVRDGEIGLTMHNGSPVFLAPGRYVLLSFTHDFVRAANINEDLIQHGPVTIVTVKKGHIGMSWKNGHPIILEEGRHILRAPHIYEATKRIGEKYLEMGPYKRILVNEGEVGVAYDTGKLMILEPGLHVRNSPNFEFNGQFVSIQTQVKRLDPLKVTTNDGIGITVHSVLTYCMHDPAKAFKDVRNVDEALFDRAEATMTSIFLHHSIDEIAPTVPGAKNEVPEVPGGGGFDAGAGDDGCPASCEGGGPADAHGSLHSAKGKEKVADAEVSGMRFSDIVREAFLDQLRDNVETWGITLVDMSIEKLEFNDADFKKLIAQRASNKIQTASDRANVAAQAATGVQKALGAAKEQKIRADAELYTAEQRAKGARMQEDSGLARELAVLRGLKDVVEAAGSKTTFIPWNMKLDVRDGGEGYWMSDGSRDASRSAVIRS